MTDDGNIERMMAAMASTDIHVRGKAKVKGLELIESGGATAAFREAFWLALICDLKSPLGNMHDPLQFMVKIDRIATLNMIKLPSMLHPHHPLLEVMLRTLVAHRVSLSVNQVESLKNRIPAKLKQNGSFERLLLMIAAIAKCRGIAERIDRALQHELCAPRHEFKGWRFESACRARELYHGLASLGSGPAMVEKDIGLVRDLACIDLLFVLGDNWFDGRDPRVVVLPMLARLDLPKHAELFEAAATRFQGADLVWPAPEIARERGSSLRDAELEGESGFFEDLQAQWYELNRELIIATEAYAWEHRRPLSAN